MGYKKKALLAEEQKTILEKTLHEYKKELLLCNTVYDFSKIKDQINEVVGNNIIKDKDFQCCMNARVCIDEYKSTRINLKDKMNNLSEVINATSQVIKVIEQMNTLIDTLKNKKYVYLKFKLDRNDELIGFILDYNNVFNFNRIATLYGIIGSRYFNECSNQGRIYMFLEFYIESQVSRLKIVDFFVSKDKIRCYHGTLTLETLIEAVKVINKNIVKSNNKLNIAEISEIYGSIKPHEAYISRQDLYRFYDKNGFIAERKLLKRISNYEKSYN